MIVSHFSALIISMVFLLTPLSVFSSVDNYERNIKVLDTLIYDIGSSDALKRTFVINRGRNHGTRQELLNNYTTALN